MNETTLKHLKEAFAGESQANRKYLAFAAVAEAEGHSNAAKMFRAAAEAETIHALAHLKAMKGIGSTAENLREGVNGETYEFATMYPPMLAAAEAAGEKEAARAFKFALQAEQVHAELYAKILNNLDAKEELSFHLCVVCGNVELTLPAMCSICGVGPQQFKLVN
ncbi:MAG: rubrerythrin family protein [Firmicutes bacterium]|nr:rubrerythrin family protein [Dethiobacter sp.]MBS3889508.1 rubrerythrin family protein [Bacillota bacterium]MBS4055622.1 rubrerythrin family protein [Thermaerobacter sp.]